MNSTFYEIINFSSFISAKKTVPFGPDFLLRTYLKNKISIQGKARNGEKAEHTRSM